MKQNRKIIAGGCRVKGGHFKMRNSRACLCVYKNDPVERDSQVGEKEQNSEHTWREWPLLER